MRRRRWGLADSWRTATTQPRSEPKPPTNYLSKWAVRLPETPLMTRKELSELMQKADNEKIHVHKNPT